MMCFNYLRLLYFLARGAICVTFQTVLWLFALKHTSDVVVIIFSGCLVTKKDYLKNFTAL